MYGLSADEWSDLVLSVNTHQGTRKLSPVEVGKSISRALTRCGAKELSQSLGFSDTTTLRRLDRLSRVPQELADLVAWRSEPGKVSMSVATELLRLEEGEREAIMSAIANRLTKEEARQLVQIQSRSGKSIDTCVGEVLLTRPRIERRELVIGRLTNPAAIEGLGQIGEAKARRAVQAGLARDHPGQTCLSLRMQGNGQFSMLFSPADVAAIRARIAPSSIEQTVANYILSVT